jgi:hypothetical protein
MRKILLILVVIGLMGCSSAPVVLDCPKCPVVPKCPDSYVELWREAEDAADRLEDALRETEEGSQACVRVFEDYQKKSVK